MSLGNTDIVTYLLSAMKNKNVVTLEVNGIMTPGDAGEPGFGITNTNDPFYVGGVPG